MGDLNWLKFLDRIALEKSLTRTQKETLKAKFPGLGLIVDDSDLSYKSKDPTEEDLSILGIAESSLTSRLTVLYEKFGIPKKDTDKAIALRNHLQNEYPKWLQQQEQGSLVKKLPPTTSETIQATPAIPQIDWLDRSRQLLKAQKHLTTNRLLNKSNRNLDDIHVPLGLIERKERPKVKEEPSPEQGSQLYQTEYTETKRFEHEAFLADVVGKPAGGKHIAIIGEPGAGKTTILTKIGAWLIEQAEQQPPAPLVVAWISLADVGDRRLREYLQAEWLQKVCEDNFDVAWEDWKGLRQQGRVWLLLDGLDEMSGDALAAIHRDLGQAWAQNLRVVMTCRINQWETAAGGNILTNSFDVYRTLDYSYQTSQGDDQVKEFISKWFADHQKVATQIRTELDAPGKERIKDLVKNPLRLTLLCASWEKDNQALPETQAGLYEKFVDYLYDWKAVAFYKEVELREELCFLPSDVSGIFCSL
ncbi:NACHT domain-containing NTPase [Chamaesiphon sp.]|uniref:NACHT domain-containing protein n=1 Tax=Chamaesiphon sp. TaxID=2814140 RepID=UPI003592F27E